MTACEGRKEFQRTWPNSLDKQLLMTANDVEDRRESAETERAQRLNHWQATNDGTAPPQQAAVGFGLG